MLRKIIIIVSLLLLNATHSLFACALGGPSFAIPLNSEYAEIHYQHIGGNLESYLENELEIKTWHFAEDTELKLILPEYTDELVTARIEIPAVCIEPGKQCSRLHIVVIASVPIAKQFRGIKEQQDPNYPQYTAIINDVDVKLVTGFRYAGEFRFAKEIKEIAQRIRVTERENGVYVVLEVVDKKTGKVSNLVAGKRIYTSINTCGARYWVEDYETGALFNNRQWQEWNNYYYENYDKYVQFLGDWMEPYRLENPKQYFEYKK
jgi:hypothetical protein